MWTGMFAGTFAGVLTWFKRLVLLVVLPCALGQAFSACSSGLRSFDELNSPGDDLSLSVCRDAGRAEKQAHGDAQAAYAAYLECTREAGLR